MCLVMLLETSVFPYWMDLGLTFLSALDKKKYLMIFFSYCSSKPYVVTPHLNRVKTVQMRGHNIYFYAELKKIIPNSHQILPLI